MHKKLTVIAVTAFLSSACASNSGRQVVSLPPLSEYCLVAQRTITRTEQPAALRVHDSFDSFVLSKAVIPDTNGAIPEIQQYQWRDSSGAVLGISCKLKSADHLNLVYGDGTAGPDGQCRDMNLLVYRALTGSAGTGHVTVLFDDDQTVGNEEQPGMTGPEWLQPYEMTYIDGDNRVHVRAKGFRVDFTDPRFSRAPPRFRGIHYCHLIAPDHLLAVMAGTAEPDTVIGREVDTSGFKAPGESR